MRIRISKEDHAKATTCSDNANLTFKRWVQLQVKRFADSYDGSPVSCGGREYSTVVELYDTTASQDAVRYAISRGVAKYTEAQDRELHNALVVKASYEGKPLEQVKREFEERIENRRRELAGVSK